MSFAFLRRREVFAFGAPPLAMALRCTVFEIAIVAINVAACEL